MIRTKQQRRRDRRRPDAAVEVPLPNASVVDVVASGGTEITITFDSPVMISNVNLPTTWLFGTGNRKITAIVSSTLTEYVCTVDGSVAAAQAYVMPANDTAARTTSGGYVNASSGNLV